MLNPMAFVTPAPGTSGPIGAGASLGRLGEEMRSNREREKNSQGYLALQTRQQDFNEEQHRHAEMDKAIADLDDARLLGNADHVALAEDNLRRVAQRNGFGISAEESARSPGGESTTYIDRELPAAAGTDAVETDAEPESAEPTETPHETDTTEQQEAFFRGLAAKGKKGKTTAPAVPKVSTADQEEAASNARIDAELEKDRLLSRQFGGQLPPRAEVAEGPAKESGAPELMVPGQLPPQRSLSTLTITDSKGRPFYQAGGDAKSVADRQRARALGVFQELSKQAGSEGEQRLIRQSGDVAAGLVGTMPLERAVQHGLDLYRQGMLNSNKLEVVQANRKPRFGGGGSVGAPKGDGWATGRAGAAMNQFSAEMDDTVRITMEKYKLPALNSSDQQVRSAAAGLQRADNPASQRIAVKQIIKAMSGLTVSVQESQFYDQAAGIQAQMENLVSRFTGDEMSPEYVQAINGVVQQWMSLTDEIRKSAAQDGADFFASKVSGRAPDDAIQQAAGGVYNMLVGGGSAPKSSAGKRANVAPGNKGDSKPKGNPDKDAAVKELLKRLGK